MHLFFLVSGLGNGGVYAALALALVVTYRSSGVVNFATGAIALFSAYMFVFFRKGQVLVPFPFLPKKVDLPFQPSTPLAVLMALVVSAAMGALLYGLVFRPLRSAPAVAKAVASLGIMVLLQALLAEQAGTAAINTPPMFPKGTVRVAGQNMNTQILWVAGIVGLVSAVLWASYRFTQFGLATRGAAETEKGALVSGLSPDRIALANWIISATVIGIAGVLIAPIAPIQTFSYTLYVVPALAAALVGSFTSIPIAVGAGFLIGALNSDLGFIVTKHRLEWITASAVAALVPLALILGYLVVRGRPLPSRGAIVLKSLGRAPRPHSVRGAVVIGAIIGTAALVLMPSGGYRGALTSTFIYAIIALSLVVITGYAGQISLAQLTLAGAGAFALSRLTLDMGVPFPIAPILAGLAAMVIGVVVGLPALRVRGLPVAIVTFALAVFLDYFWFQNPKFTNHNQPTVKAPRLFGYDLSASVGRDINRVSFGLMCLGVLLVVGAAVALLRRTTLGAAMLAVRANERSAAAAGIDVARTKVVAFAIGSFIAGLGGALLAYQQTQANESQFAPIAGLFFFAAVYLSGITSVHGGLIAGLISVGGLVYYLLNDHFDLGNWYQVATGVLLIVNVVNKPEGLAAPFHSAMAKYHERQRARSAPDARDPHVPPEPRPRDEIHAGPTVLTVSDLSVRYGGVTAVDECSLDVPEGLIVGLIGPNGAGKTTLIDAISGFASCSGHVMLNGRSLDGMKPHQRIRAGMGRTFQGIELYEDLSVAENIAVGEAAVRFRTDAANSHDVDAQRAPTDVHGLCELLGLSDVIDRPVRELSQGRRQLVSVARALAGRPRLLLLDEPAGGLDSTESQWLGERLRGVRDAGVTILLIDHDMHLVLNLCDRIHVLDLGRLIASGTPEQIKADPLVTAAYLGDTHGGEPVR
jgi:ABC-type branched-subunit amino acid transport system ATPase component/branched-subunit amino acid ABC-type transport system permease component